MLSASSAQASTNSRNSAANRVSPNTHEAHHSSSPLAQAVKPKLCHSPNAQP